MLPGQTVHWAPGHEATNRDGFGHRACWNITGQGGILYYAGHIGRIKEDTEECVRIWYSPRHEKS